MSEYTQRMQIFFPIYAVFMSCHKFEAPEVRYMLVLLKAMKIFVFGCVLVVVFFFVFFFHCLARSHKFSNIILK